MFKSVEVSEDVKADLSSSEEFLVPKVKKVQIDEEVLEGVSRGPGVPDASKGEVCDLDVVQVLPDVGAQVEDLGAFGGPSSGDQIGGTIPVEGVTDLNVHVPNDWYQEYVPTSSPQC